MNIFFNNLTLKTSYTLREPWITHTSNALNIMENCRRTLSKIGY